MTKYVQVCSDANTLNKKNKRDVKKFASISMPKWKEKIFQILVRDTPDDGALKTNNIQSTLTKGNTENKSTASENQ